MERLNSNIYKNIFPEDVLDLNHIEELKKYTVHSTSEIRQDNHGFQIGDVVSLRDKKYVLAIADDDHKFERICGVVMAVRNENIFSLMDSGKLPYEHRNFTDTTILYLSDKIPGKMCHYREIDNMTYIPIAIYIDDSILINILGGVTGAPLAPYEDINDSAPIFQRYTQAELDTVSVAIWGA